MAELDRRRLIQGLAAAAVAGPLEAQAQTANDVLSPFLDEKTGTPEERRKLALDVVDAITASDPDAKTNSYCRNGFCQKLYQAGPAQASVSFYIKGGVVSHLMVFVEWRDDSGGFNPVVELEASEDLREIKSTIDRLRAHQIEGKPVDLRMRDRDSVTPEAYQYILRLYRGTLLSILARG